MGGGSSNSNQSLILNNSMVSENTASSCAGISGDDDSIVLTNRQPQYRLFQRRRICKCSEREGKAKLNGSSAVDRNAATNAMSIRL